MADPPRRAALLALAERVEQASEGADELDRDISRLLPDDLWAKGGAWTASVDAALSLKPAGWVLTVLGEGYQAAGQDQSFPGR